MIRVLYLIILVSLLGCSSEQPIRPNIIQDPPVVEESKPEEPLPVAEIKAPWEINYDRDEELGKLLSEKNIKQALLLISERKKVNPSPQIFSEQASLLLKLGRPEEALGTISEFASSNQLGMENLPSELALIAAYAYKCQKDIDQTFAWFGVTIRKTSSPEAAQVATLEVKNLLSRISDKIFANYFIKWERDQSLSPLILEEQIRRRNGGSVVRLEETDYFSPGTYGYLGKEFTKSLIPAQSEKADEIVLIVPTKSNKVLEGQKKALELALSAAVPPIGFKVVPPQTDPVQTPPKVMINLGVKNVAFPTAPKDAVVISINPRLSQAETSIAPKIAEEIQELIKISESGFQCDQTFAVVEDSIALPPKIKRTSVDELLAIASTGGTIASPCLIGSFEIEDQIEKLTRIKGRLTGLRLFGRSSWVDPVLLQTYQGLFEGSVFITPFYSGSTRELTREFLSSFQNNGGSEGTYADALAYDAGRISALILGNKQPEGASYTLQSVTGIEAFVVSIDKASGAKRVSVSERRFTRLTFRNGELEELSSY